MTVPLLTPTSNVGSNIFHPRLVYDGRALTTSSYSPVTPVNMLLFFENSPFAFFMVGFAPLTSLLVD